MAKAEKMYAKPPVMERDEEGKLGVKKPSKADADQSGTEGMALEVHQAHERHGMHHRHEMEHMAMHHGHEKEHAAHDAAKGSDKSKMHDKHETEIKEMHKRHHEEMKKMHKKHEKGGHGAEESGLEKPAKEKAEMPKENKKAKVDKSGEEE